MCGICGWLRLNALPNGAIVREMNNIAKHRGPDDEGYLAISKKNLYELNGDDSCKDRVYSGKIDEFNLEKSECFLLFGHRRLSIIDVTTNGHQPMKCDNKKLAITFNGEIYNYLEIRSELQEKGYAFDTSTDTEVIIAAYAEWGEDCVSRFNGMWAFAIWDQKEHKLFCSRDRLGAKPFYYYLNNSEFVFASEMKQIIQNPNVKRKLNVEYFSCQTVFDYSDFSEDSLIKDVKVLRGGYNLSIQLDKDDRIIESVNKYKYWDIDTEKKDAEAENIVFDFLEDSIKLRLRSDVPVGVLLSGGVDSSCLVSTISELYKEKASDKEEVATFTSCYNNFDEGDEKYYARLVNEHCNTKANYIYPDEEDTFETLKDMVWHLEGNCNYNVLGSFLLLKEISKLGYKVLLNGQGADETQFGYERYYVYYFKDAIRNGKFRKAFKDFLSARGNSRLSFKDLVSYYFYFNCPILRQVRCIMRVRPYVSSEIIRSVKNQDEFRKLLKFHSMSDMLYHELKSTQLPNILRLDDRLYMAHSLESRVPFIDYRYVEQAVKIPDANKIQNGYTKYLLRKRYENRLPKEVIWRKNKMGWPSPEARWAARFDKEKMDDLFNNPRTKDIFNVDRIKKIKDKSPTNYVVEKFVITELFVRLFDLTVEI